VKELFPYDRYHFKHEALFKDLNNDVLEILNRNKRILTFKKGETIFHEGMNPSGIFIVQEGHLKKFSLGADGKEHIFYIYQRGEVLGHHAVLSSEPYSDTSVTMDDCKLAFIPKEDFLEAVHSSHSFTQTLLENISHEFGVFVNRSKILAQHSVRERTAIALLILNERNIENYNSSIPIRLPRMDLANLIGTTKETLVRVLHDLKEEKVVSTEGLSITILDRNELIQISNFK